MPRRPVNAPYQITTEFGVPDKYAKFGRHSGVDYAVPAGRAIFATVSGQLQNIVSPTGGNMVVIYDGKYWHRLMHNSSFTRNNGYVNEGEQVATAGTTGLSTGVHSHWDINKEGIYPTSFAAFIPPADYLAGMYQVTQGAEMFNTLEEVKEAYLQMRGVVGTDAEMRGWIGQSKQRWIQMSKAETDGLRAERDALRGQLQSVQQALANEQAKPPKEVVKIVEKIVEKEVIKEVLIEAPVDEQAVVTGFFKKLLAKLTSLFWGKG
jgi:hypothetical protein